MCNLGFQTVYSLFNSARDFVCERVFAEPVLFGSRSAGRGDWTGDDQYHVASRLEALGEPLAVESQRPLSDFSVIAFSLSFELDYFNVGDVLRRSGIAPMAADRTENDPIVIAGGPAVSANPEPVAPMLDAVLIGEVEPAIAGLQEVFLVAAVAPSRSKNSPDCWRVRAVAIRHQLRRRRHDSTRQTIEP